MPKPSKNQKQYIVRKYIMAKSAQEALRKERTRRPDDVYIDDEWRKENKQNLESAIGFQVEREYDED